jgi:ectoine hydroxylase-related dioxygenase (phytanoyl-CoA dioxygenase family)
MMNKAIDFFKKNGYYHAENHFEQSLINDLKNDFYPYFQEKKKRFENRFSNDQTNYGANHDINRWNMLLPSETSLITSCFYSDSTIFSILKGVFNSEFSLVFFSSDIAAPGSEFQTIHQDGNDFAVALNIPLVESNEFNGSTQIFPGTHSEKIHGDFTNESNTFTDEETLERSALVKPIHLNLKTGDATLRDLRLIHRGTPNHSNEIRPYLSAIFLPVEAENAPTFETIEKGLDVFEKFKKEAFEIGNIDLIDYANTFGRLVMGFSNSDRIKRPISKKISDQLDENALYCFRFAKFEDETLNTKIIRNENTSRPLEDEIQNALVEFEELKNTELKTK